MWSLRGLRGAVAVVATLCAAGCSWGLMRFQAEGRSDVLSEAVGPYEAVPGITRFAWDDLGGLHTDAMDTHAFPLKVLVAALLLRRSEQGEAVAFREEAVLPILQEFGFIIPDTILNMRDALQPNRYASPLGLLRGIASRRFPVVELEIANLGCAACHSGVTYDSVGTPRGAVWMGLPNTSLNLDALTNELYEALLLAIETPDQFRATLDLIYPDLPAAEKATLRRLLPMIQKRVAESRDRWGRLGPYAPGGPGMGNAVGAARHVLGLFDPAGGAVGVGGAVSIPDLGDRLLKSSFAVDGTFGAPGEARFRPLRPEDLTDAHMDAKAGVIAFFSVPIMGVKPHRVESIVPRIRDILEFLKEYRPPPFPGAVDLALTKAGERLFTDRCGSCHGEYSSIPNVRLQRYPNVVVPVENVGTDPTRWEAAEPALATAIQESAAGNLLAVGPTPGYVPPPLTGLWATAPYLHNGSVPTLWHMMHPELRPDRFHVGGHRLDFEWLGIDGETARDGIYRYPDGYEPWSTPFVFDTALPGQSNRGHEKPFQDLSGAEKRALLEYLKLL